MSHEWLLTARTPLSAVGSSMSVTRWTQTNVMYVCMYVDYVRGEGATSNNT